MLLPPATASPSVPAAAARFAARSAAPAAAAAAASARKCGRVLLCVATPRRGAPAGRVRAALSFSTSAAPGTAENNWSPSQKAKNAGGESGDGWGPSQSVDFRTLYSACLDVEPAAGDVSPSADDSKSGASAGAGSEQGWAELGDRRGSQCNLEHQMRSSESTHLRRAGCQPPQRTVRWSPEVAEEAKELQALGSFGLTSEQRSLTRLTRKGDIMSEAETTVRAAELPSLVPDQARQLAKLYANCKSYTPIPKVLRKYMDLQPRPSADEKLNILRNNAGLFLVRFPTYEPDWTWFRPWMNGCPPLSPDELRKKRDVDLKQLEFAGGNYAADMEAFPQVAVNEKLVDELGLRPQLENINLTLNANPTLTTEKRREMKRRIFEVVGAIAPTPVKGKDIRKHSKILYRFWRPKHHQRIDFPYNSRVPAGTMARVFVAKARAAAAQ